MLFIVLGAFFIKSKKLTLSGMSNEDTTKPTNCFGLQIFGGG